MTTPNRSRSASHGATSLKIYREGVDPYAMEPVTATQKDMVESGRAGECAYLISFSRGIRNEAKWMCSMANGSDMMDRFRVISGSVSGFVAPEIRMLEKRYALVERGETGKVYFVSLSQRCYDKRIGCFDLTRSQMVILVALIAIIAGLLYVAFVLDTISHNGQSPLQRINLPVESLQDLLSNLTKSEE